jgi:hypothetical protein
MLEDCFKYYKGY